MTLDSLFRPALALLLFAITSTYSGQVALAQTVLLENTLDQSGSPYSLEKLNCPSNANSLHIKGAVELRHPADTDTRATPKTISINCEHLIFSEGAVLRSRSAIEIRIAKTAAGPIRIESTRGIKGDDAVSDPAVYRAVKVRSGRAGADGSNGRNAETDLKGDWDSERGGGGGPGGDGDHGLAGRSGDPGRAGITASSLSLWVGRFAPNAAVSLIAVGGGGGKGSKGGRGQDGGDGGRGGNAGAGGNANELHSASNGGDGGKGGDGGNGGNGGRGGDGGDAGDGGNLFVYITTKDGSPPSDLEMKNGGGVGGDPGFGGDPGSHGRGGPGGIAGCGGAGKDWGPLRWNGAGSCGGAGTPGRPGIDGKPGPIGAWGRDGRDGNRGDWKWGRVDPAPGAAR